MKQIYFVLIIFPLLFSCTQTKEEKAAEIAKSEMIKIIYNVDSYKPIETQIDSAFTSIYTNLDVVRAAHDLIELNADEKKSNCNDNIILPNHRLQSGAIQEVGAVMPKKNIGKQKMKWMITPNNSKN